MPLPFFLRRYWFLIGLCFVAPAGLFFPEGGKAIGDSGAVLSGLVAATLFISGFTLDTRHLVRQATNVRAILLTLLSTYAVAPALALLLARLFGPAASGADSKGFFFVQSVMIAAAQATTLASAIAFTMVAGGDKELALVLTVFSSALTAFLTPLVLGLTAGTTVTLPVGSMMERMALVILAPVALGQIARRLLWTWATPHLKILRLLPQLIILVFVYTGCSTASEELNRDLVLAFRFLAASASLHLLLLAWTYASATLLGLPAASRTAVVFCGSQKTLPNGIYIWKAFFPSNPSGAVALVLYHIFQLLADTLLLPFLAGGRNMRQTEIVPAARSSR